MRLPEDPNPSIQGRHSQPTTPWSGGAVTSLWAEPGVPLGNQERSGPELRWPAGSRCAG